jgi:hypothetical protein
MKAERSLPHSQQPDNGPIMEEGQNRPFVDVSSSHADTHARLHAHTHTQKNA